MINKTIHYCWFGGNPLPVLAKKCIESWKKYCPEYEIMRWDETNFDVNMLPYTKEAYENKKYAFVSDVARLYALVNYGGIYLDTDVELIKPLDVFLDCDAFSGFESSIVVSTGIMACTIGNKLFSEFLSEYKNIHFVLDDGSLDCSANTIRITETCKKYGLKLNGEKQVINGFVLYPSDYFCPKSLFTRQITLSENTCAIHHFNGSWLNEEERFLNSLKERLSAYLPFTFARIISRVITIIKYEGASKVFSYFARYFC